MLNAGSVDLISVFCRLEKNRQQETHENTHHRVLDENNFAWANEWGPDTMIDMQDPGLRHRPELREEAIANMGEHLLREAQDSSEIFMTQNFIHYLRCLCVDEFNRVLRQEGLYYKRDEEGRPAGRPQHVPRSLIEPLRPPQADEEGSYMADVADPNDQYEQMHAADESLRILTYLTDPLDRTILVLRAIEGMKWDDIAQVCKRTERTVRLRYERARSYLRECLSREHVEYRQIPQQSN